MQHQQNTANASYLDRCIPLQSASHADVAEYRVDIPLRYAQVYAHLTDGRIVRLMDAKQFLGWVGYGANPSLLFASGGRRIVMHLSGDESRIRNFIARDGSQVRLRRWQTKWIKYFVPGTTPERTPIRDNMPAGAVA